MPAWLTRVAALKPINELTFVMLGFVPGIHVLLACCEKDMDRRDRPGHDGIG